MAKFYAHCTNRFKIDHPPHFYTKQWMTQPLIYLIKKACQGPRQ